MVHAKKEKEAEGGREVGRQREGGRGGREVGYIQYIVL